VGRDLARRFGFELGDRIPLRGTIFQGTWEFNVRAIYEGARPEDPTADMWIRYDYLEESREILEGMVGWYVVRVQDPSLSDEVALAINQRFENSPFETRAESEKAFLTGFANQIGNIRLLVLSVGAVVFVTLLLVSGNTMAIAVRERFGELAVMKTMGFSNPLLLLLVSSEAVVLALVGGSAGLIAAKVFTLFGDPTNGLLAVFYLAPGEMAFGLALSLAVGVVSGLAPAVGAVRASIVSGLKGV
jgi:putative ABC transport system permease protein